MRGEDGHVGGRDVSKEGKNSDGDSCTPLRNGIQGKNSLEVVKTSIKWTSLDRRMNGLSSLHYAAGP